MASYTEADIKSLDWREHIRLRPGMYIGKLGDGSAADDGIYILLKEAIDNAVDEHIMGFGKEIRIQISDEGWVEVRDFGRGIPLGKLYDCAAQINTGAKYDSEAFKKSVGLNGVGIKAVNALSSVFEIQSWREGLTRAIQFSQGKLVEDQEQRSEAEANGTRLRFQMDAMLFPPKTMFRETLVEKMCRYYAYLNPQLTLVLNGKKFRAKDGLLDLLREEMESEALYAPIHLVGKDIEIAFTHTEESTEQYYTFVNGQHTSQGGTHLQAFREAIVAVVRGFFKKQWEPVDIRAGIEAALCVRIEEPVFESQTKTKLGSAATKPQGGESLRTFIGNFLKEHLDNYLHKNPQAAEALQKRIVAAERERKELKGVQKLARERSRQARVHNKKLRDCRIHLDSKHKRREESTIFITEGDSASGSITKCRDVETQAVFSLRGKPLNTYDLARKIVYENEEFALLQAALNLEEGIAGLRYQRVVIATDADVDGMHIRLLLLTFFLQFFPELIRDGHLFILQTPLFRVRNRKETRYCYDESERRAAIKQLGKNAEITRFKGLGEISPNEFAFMIGAQMRIEPVQFLEGKGVKELLSFYMGKNTPDRQDYIIHHLREDVDRQISSDDLLPSI